MTPTPEQIARARRVPYSSAAIAEAIAEAEVRAVAAERAAVVAWLRSEGPDSPADVWGAAFAGSEWTTAADFIEAGAHRKEQA